MGKSLSHFLQGTHEFPIYSPVVGSVADPIVGSVISVVVVVGPVVGTESGKLKYVNKTKRLRTEMRATKFEN